MTKSRPVQLRQLSIFYLIVALSGFLWRPRSTAAALVIMALIFGVAPWLVLRKRTPEEG